MVYICPKCTFHTLFEKSTQEMPPDISADEFTFLALECSSCQSCFLGEYIERHVPIDSVDSFAYAIDEKDSFAKLVSLFQSCTNTTDKNDDCEIHQKLLSANTNNNWQQMDWEKFHIHINQENIYPLNISEDLGIPPYMPV